MGLEEETRKKRGRTPIISGPRLSLVDSPTIADRQYVWGLRYVDELILRDRDTDDNGGTGTTGLTTGNSGLNERLYALQDANYNVTALVNPSGAVQERITYSVFGTPTFYDSSWANESSASSKDWETLFAGYRHDSETGLYHVRTVSTAPCGFDWAVRLSRVRPASRWFRPGRGGRTPGRGSRAIPWAA